MPHGGWWIHRDGRVREVHEHLEAVVESPRAFGLRKADLVPRRRETLADRRERLLTEAMRQGWIRVRLDRSDPAFEYWDMRPAVARAIWDFLEKAIGPGHAIRMGEVSTGLAFSANVDSLFGDGRRRPRRSTPPSRFLFLVCRALGHGRRK